MDKIRLYLGNGLSFTRQRDNKQAEKSVRQEKILWFGYHFSLNICRIEREYRIWLFLTQL